MTAIAQPRARLARSATWPAIAGRRRRVAANGLILFVGAVVIVESLIGYYTGNQPADESRYTELRRLMLFWYAAGIGAMLAMSTLSRRPALANVRVSPTILFAAVAIAISCALNWQMPTPLVIAAPFLAKFAVFGLRRLPFTLKASVLTVPLVLFTVAPTLIFLFRPDLRELFVFHDNTFRGLGASRADFGYLLGLATVTVLSGSSWFWRLSVPFLLCGIWLTESRATIAATAAAVMVLVWWRHRRYAVYALVLALVVAPLILLAGLPSIGSIATTREDFFIDWGGRFELIRSGLIHSYHTGVLFGSGRFYVNVVARDGTFKEVHNAAIQSLVNFGLILTVVWYALMARLWRGLAAEGKAVLAFLLVFGLFQPGYEPWFFAPQVLFTFVLAECLSRAKGSRPSMIPDVSRRPKVSAA